MTVIMRDKGCLPSTIGYYLVIIGAVNWGLVGVGYFLMMNFNVVNLALGSMPMFEYGVYLLVGIAGVITAIGCCCKTCKACRVDGVAEKA